MAEERKPRGKLVPQRRRQRRLRELLLSHYEANPHFMTALRAVMARHRRFLSAEERFSFEDGVNGYHYWQCREIFEGARASGNRWMAEQATLWAQAVWRRQENLKGPYRRHRLRSAPYERQLRELVENWGLRCDWASPLLHRQLIFFLTVPEQGLRLFDLGDLAKPSEGSIAEADYLPWFTIGLRDLVDPPGGYINIRVLYTPDIFEWNADQKRFVRVEWKEIETRILQEARRQRDEINRQLERARGYVRKDVEPELERHVRWLYLRICPQEDRGRPWGLATIAQEDWASVKTVKNAVVSLARELGLRLPRLRPGRPKRFREESA